MNHFCSVLSYISLCKNVSGSYSRYGHQRTNSTIGSYRFLVGSWIFLLYFFIKTFNSSIYVLIFNFFSDEYLTLRATEKNSVLGGFFGEMELYIKNLIMHFCCALFGVLFSKISSFILLPPTWVETLGDWRGDIKKLFNICLFNSVRT